MNAFSKTVHPHGRGDNDTADDLVGRIGGSPPRAWGQSDRGQAGCGWSRFTPTGVGTMTSGTPTSPAMAVHPHGRGDNATTCWAPGDLIGSPPRAWGQFRQRVARHRLERFTPTGVGTMIRISTKTV